MNILHFAVENFARVPEALVRAERELGHQSRLVTLYPTRRQFDDGAICLNMPLVGSAPLDTLKGWLHRNDPPVMSNRRRDDLSGPPVWNPGKGLRKALFDLRDELWEPRIRRVLKQLDIDAVDLLYLDGGAGFLRSGKIIQELKAAGKTLGVTYFGSDLRTRGIIPQVDFLADARFTMEFDHSLLYPAAEFLFFPFRLAEMPDPGPREPGPVRIGHAPTNRAVKGTDAILAELEALRQSHPIDIVLIENLPHVEALRLKATCDLFIDNIGELGYGINSLEALAMGIPTAVQLLQDFEAVLGDHSFIAIEKGTIGPALLPYIQSVEKRKALAEKGRAWVEKTHDPVRIVRHMLSRFKS